MKVQFVSSTMREERYVGVAACEYFGEFFGLASGDNRILITRGNKNGKVREIPNYVGRKRHHRAEKHGSREVVGVKQDQTGCDVCSIGIANGDQLLRADVISLRSRFNELC